MRAPKKAPIHMGQFIRRARTIARVTQTALAEAVGVTEACVCGWEMGRTLPKKERLPDIAAALGMAEESFQEEWELALTVTTEQDPTSQLAKEMEEFVAHPPDWISIAKVRRLTLLIDRCSEAIAKTKRRRRTSAGPTKTGAKQAKRK